MRVAIDTHGCRLNRFESDAMAQALEQAGHVLVDGKDYGSRLRELPVDTGPHELLLRHHGYVDEHLHWTATAGRTRRGFVALRKALAWSRPASGSFLEAHWLGDANGDGLDDLVSRRFNLLTAYDPWDDRELWQVSVREGALYGLCDVDGDGALDVAVLWPGKEGSELLLYGGRAMQRRPAPRWAVSVDAAPAPRLGLGAVACVPQAAGGADLVVAGLHAGEVEAYGARGDRR
ncbi:MAG: hypothetical protein KDK70_38085, partial [Myxococcales bacterium]|nr:hypothetical protein [Myxococcales bacterium]